MSFAFVQGRSFVRPVSTKKSTSRANSLVPTKTLIILLAFISSEFIGFAQDSTIDKVAQGGLQLGTPAAQSSVNKNRVWLVAGINAVAYGSSLIILSNVWYKDYPRTSFHTFNDNGEWLQVDKVGHGWTAYNTGRISAGLWRWAGLPQKKAAIIGGISGVLYLTIIEFLDGHSSQWGWSWGDMAANIIGSGIFVSQELLWKEQRIQYKFSFHHNDYGEPMLNERADDLFGEGWYERILKDYNAQTYWLSANLKSFFPGSKLPRWLNLSVGYGADGMFGGFENKWIDEDTGSEIDRTDIPRKRQFYLAPDIDFTKIKSNKKWVRTVLFCLNAFKCPAPTLMIDSKGKVKAYPLYF